eukprot:TRINITY_DN33887_c0_g1_i2.p1 TRINITY_DN33887_c0_g1~~TRINITY_DN33887_c0_g1_i2.p1  ORF type:complete len:205 (+),score=40.48 TRINITY_DN33887_c0_g1_i2:162-776(+)
MCESGSRSVWENVTDSTPLTQTNTGSLQFNTVVSAAFWVVHLPKWMVEDSLPMLDKLFRKMCRVPYRTRLAIFWREETNQHRHFENGHDGDESEMCEASVRVLVCTQEDRGQDGNCLETQEGYKPLVNSSDLVIHHGTNLEIFIKGNLVKLHDLASLKFQPFHENRATLNVRRVQTNISAAGNIEIMADDLSLFSASIVLPIKK